MKQPAKWVGVDVPKPKASEVEKIPFAWDAFEEIPDHLRQNNPPAPKKKSEDE